eukprot:48333-Eustigmatos_ZCMA.PRE.1
MPDEEWLPYGRDNTLQMCVQVASPPPDEVNVILKAVRDGNEGACAAVCPPHLSFCRCVIFVRYLSIRRKSELAERYSSLTIPSLFQLYLQLRD